MLGVGCTRGNRVEYTGNGVLGEHEGLLVEYTSMGCSERLAVQEGRRWDKEERFHYPGYPGVYPRETEVTLAESAGPGRAGYLPSRYAA